MFTKKYKISLIDSKWNPITRSLKIEFLPRANELIYYNEQYYNIVNVIHDFSREQSLVLIVEPTKKNNLNDI